MNTAQVHARRQHLPARQHRATCIPCPKPLAERTEEQLGAQANSAAAFSALASLGLASPHRPRTVPVGRGANVDSFCQDGVCAKKRNSGCATCETRTKTCTHIFRLEHYPSLPNQGGQTCFRRGSSCLSPKLRQKQRRGKLVSGHVGVLGWGVRPPRTSACAPALFARGVRRVSGAAQAPRARPAAWSHSAAWAASGSVPSSVASESKDGPAPKWVSREEASTSLKRSGARGLIRRRSLWLELRYGGG